MTETIALKHKDFLAAEKDPERAASVINLIYITDSAPGIQRVRKGKGFSYIFEEKPLHDKAEVERIKKLRIPPAWQNVWISPVENSHLQATGNDTKNRKQYLYHALWNKLRNETKYHHLYEFGKHLPQIRLQIEKDLQLKDLCKEKVLATVLSLMERTYIRVGNNDYERLYGSYGITTLKDKHVNINGSKLLFSFKGKKGVHHDISLVNKKLARTVKQCRDIPGKELFQYYDENGKRQSIDSGMVNQYIKDAAGRSFTAKDFRTWAGTLHALHEFASIGDAINETQAKKNVVEVLNKVSEKLGNTRTVCRKYYVHPALIEMYHDKKLSAYLKDINEIEKPDDISGLTEEECLLMRILKDVIHSKK